MDYRKTEFVLSAASPAAFLRDGRPQVAFAGRSNVGKSSVINCLTYRKNLARVGETPGKTAHVNYFLTENRAYLTDLPGYGFARVSHEERDRWAALMEAYFAERALVTLGVLILDARHKPTQDDVTMAAWFRRMERPLLLVANKIDKLKPRETEENLSVIRRTLEMPDTELIPFSAQTGAGREQLTAAMNAALAHGGSGDG